MSFAAPDGETLVVAEPEVRLDRFLHYTYPEISTNQWRRVLKQGEISVDGRRGLKGEALAAGQKVLIPKKILECLLATQPEPETGFELEIIYEDEELIALNKPADCHTHPLSAAETGTLANQLIAAFPELVGVGGFGPLQPGLLNRLDFATSGIVLAARSNPAWERLRQAFSRHLVRKEYVAVVRGFVEEGFVVDKTLTHDAHDRRRMAVTPPADACRGLYPARTEVLPLSYAADRDVSLVQLVMYSGVMHQLRVHLAAAGHPLVGDRLYGGGDFAPDAADSSALDDERIFYLHCFKLSLPDNRQISAPAAAWCENFS